MITRLALTYLPTSSESQDDRPMFPKPSFIAAVIFFFLDFICNFFYHVFRAKLVFIESSVIFVV